MEMFPDCFVGPEGGALEKVSVRHAKKMWLENADSHDWYVDVADNPRGVGSSAFPFGVDPKNPELQANFAYRFRVKRVS